MLQTFCSCGKGWGLPVVHRLLIVVVSLVEPRLYRAGSVAVEQGLNCPKKYGIFQNQGLNLCPLHWQGDS